MNRRGICRKHKDLILAALKRHGPCTAADLADHIFMDHQIDLSASGLGRLLSFLDVPCKPCYSLKNYPTSRPKQIRTWLFHVEE